MRLWTGVFYTDNEFKQMPLIQVTSGGQRSLLKKKLQVCESQQSCLFVGDQILIFHHHLQINSLKILQCDFLDLFSPRRMPNHLVREHQGSFRHTLNLSSERGQAENKEATETVSIRIFSNQKPWVDRTIRDVVNIKLPHTTPVFCRET